MLSKLEQLKKTSNFVETNDDFNLIKPESFDLTEPVDLEDADLGTNALEDINNSGDIDLVDISLPELEEFGLSLEPSANDKVERISNDIAILENIIKSTDNVSGNKTDRNAKIKSFIDNTVEMQLNNATSVAFAGVRINTKSFDDVYDDLQDEFDNLSNEELIIKLANAHNKLKAYFSNNKSDLKSFGVKFENNLTLDDKVANWHSSNFKFDEYINTLIAEVMQLSKEEFKKIPNSNKYFNLLSTIINECIEGIKSIYEYTENRDTKELRSYLTRVKAAKKNNPAMSIPLLPVRDSGITIDIAKMTQRVTCPNCETEHEYKLLRFAERNNRTVAYQVPLICKNCGTISFINTNTMDILNSDDDLEGNNSKNKVYSIPLAALYTLDEFVVTNSSQENAASIVRIDTAQSANRLQRNYTQIQEDSLYTLLSDAYTMITQENRLLFLKANLQKISGFKNIHEITFGILEKLPISKYIKAFSELKQQYIVLDFTYKSLLKMLVSFQKDSTNPGLKGEIEKIASSYSLDGISVEHIGESIKCCRNLAEKTGLKIENIENTIQMFIDSLTLRTLTHILTFDLSPYEGMSVTQNLELNEAKFCQTTLYGELVKHNINIDNFVNNAEEGVILSILFRGELTRTKFSLVKSNKPFTDNVPDNKLPVLRKNIQANQLLSSNENYDYRVKRSTIDTEFETKTGFKIQDLKCMINNNADNETGDLLPIVNLIVAELSQSNPNFNLFCYAQVLASHLKGFEDKTLIADLLTSVDVFFSKYKELYFDSNAFLQKYSVKRYNLKVLLNRAGFKPDEYDLNYIDLPLRTYDLIKLRKEGESIQQYIKNYSESGIYENIYTNSYACKEYASLIINLLNFTQWFTLCQLTTTQDASTKINTHYIIDDLYKSFLYLHEGDLLKEKVVKLVDIHFSLPPVFTSSQHFTKLDKILANEEVFKSIKDEIASIHFNSELLEETNGKKMDYDKLFDIYDFSKVSSDNFLDYLILDELSDQITLSKVFESISAADRKRLIYYISMFSKDKENRSNVYAYYAKENICDCNSLKNEFIDYAKGILKNLRGNAAEGKIYLEEVTGVKI